MLTSSYSPFARVVPNANQVAQPRAIVMINDISVYWTDIEVQTTTFYVADNYSIVLPLNGQNPALNFNYWASTNDISVKIYIGFPSNPDSYGTADLDLFMVGDADLIDIDPLNATVTLAGRDLTSRLIDTKSSEKYSSFTASQVAISLANQHGLTPVVTPTNVKVGTIYNNLQVLMTKQITQWDLLTFLAQQSGFVAFVQKQELHFQPYPLQDANNAFVVQYQAPTSQNASPGFNGMTVSFRRSLTLAKDVKVLVRVPYNPTTGKAFTVAAQASKRTRPYLHNVPSSTAAFQTFTFIRPGLTREQAQQTANQLLQNITLHEVILEATMPGSNQLRKDSIIQVRGTNTSFDQFYYADVVYRTLSALNNGYFMRINAKNHSVDSQVNP